MCVVKTNNFFYVICLKLLINFLGDDFNFKVPKVKPTQGKFLKL